MKVEPATAEPSAKQVEEDIIHDSYGPVSNSEPTPHSEPKGEPIPDSEPKPEEELRVEVITHHSHQI